MRPVVYLFFYDGINHQGADPTLSAINCLVPGPIILLISLATSFIGLTKRHLFCGLPVPLLPDGPNLVQN